MEIQLVCVLGALILQLIPQRLAGFERVRDALLRLLLAAERDEGFALEIQNVLLADQLP